MHKHMNTTYTLNVVKVIQKQERKKKIKKILNGQLKSGENFSPFPPLRIMNKDYLLNLRP